MEAGILVDIGGAIINSIVVCLITKRLRFLVGIVPAASCEVFLLAMSYWHAHKYDGMDLTTFLHSNFISFDRMLLELLPAMIVSGICCAVASKLKTPA
jgi:hypothetical protein